MRYCDQHPEEIDKLAKVKAQVTEVKGVMMQNIEKVDVSFYYSGYQLLILCRLMKLYESTIFTFTNDVILKWLHIGY